jgi:hypothetical protein
MELIILIGYSILPLLSLILGFIGIFFNKILVDECFRLYKRKKWKLPNSKILKLIFFFVGLGALFSGVTISYVCFNLWIIY